VGPRRAPVEVLEDAIDGPGEKGDDTEHPPNFDILPVYGPDKVCVKAMLNATAEVFGQMVNILRITKKDEIIGKGRDG
jgi:hypothetical protein